MKGPLGRTGLLAATLVFCAAGCCTAPPPKQTETGGQAAPPGLSTRYSRPGFAVFEKEGRLWVFREKTPELASYVKGTEPSKRVTLIGAGPDGKTVISPEREVAEAYLAATKGKATR